MKRKASRLFFDEQFFCCCFQFSLMRLFAPLYTFQCCFGVSEVGRCFNNFSPTYNTSIRTARRVFSTDWSFLFGYVILRIDNSLQNGLFCCKALCVCEPSSTVSFLNTFSSVRVFQPNEEERRTNRNEIRKGMDRSLRVYASLFQHRII